MFAADYPKKTIGQSRPDQLSRTNFSNRLLEKLHGGKSAAACCIHQTASSVLKTSAMECVIN